MKAPSCRLRQAAQSDRGHRPAGARGGRARVIAGGQSLVAMMNLRIASPGLLIDIARLPELAGGWRRTAMSVTLGLA